MERIRRLWEQAKTIARSAPARATAIAAAVVGLAEEIATVVPDQVPDGPAALAVQLVTVAAAVVQIVRRGTYTPADRGARGVLPRSG